MNLGRYFSQDYFSFLSDCTERDILFAIDGAASVGPENFRKQVQFLEQFVQSVDLGSRKIRLGLLEISNKQQTEVIFSFGSSQNPLDIEYILDEMPYYNKPERYVGEALKKIYDLVSDDLATFLWQSGQTTCIISLKSRVQFSLGSSILNPNPIVHNKKQTTCSGLLNTTLSQPELNLQSIVTMLNNIVENIKQCGQHNIVQSLFLIALDRLCVFFAVQCEEY